MDSSLYQIIYLSSAQPPLDEAALMRLLAGTQKRNADRDITGLLLHSDGSIIQIMEGPEPAVKALYEKIRQDPRHSSVTQMSANKITERDFPDYKMGFKRVSPEILDDNLPGFSRIVEERKLDQDELEAMSRRVATFLKSFAKTTQIISF